jgi:ABC-2 type transport system permease protein
MISLASIAAIAKKELTEFGRDATLVKGVFIQPILLTLVFGMAVKSEVKNVRWAVYDDDRTVLSRSLADGIAASGAVVAPTRVGSYAGVRDLFQRGDASAAIVIPPGFARRIEDGRPAPAEVMLNGVDPLVALRFASNAAPFVARFLAPQAGHTGHGELEPHRPGTPAIMLRRVYRFNPRLGDDWYFLPTIPAIFLAQLFFGLACFSIVGERERGTYEHLSALPLSPIEILIGKAVPYFLVGAAMEGGYFLVVCLGFGLEIRGSVAVLLMAFLAYSAASYAIAAFFSSIARNVHQAIYLTVFSVLPSTVISGFLVPTSTMPRPIQIAALGLPATHYVTILRAVIVRGASLADVARPFAALGGIFAVVVLLLLAFFPRRAVA